jgi:hypothetical protein
MYSAAASRYQMPSPQERPGAQLAEEELEKLQEIHELINLIFSELPLRAQNMAAPYALPMFTGAPYSFPQPAWGGMPPPLRPNF